MAKSKKDNSGENNFIKYVLAGTAGYAMGRTPRINPKLSKLTKDAPANAPGSGFSLILDQISDIKKIFDLDGRRLGLIDLEVGYSDRTLDVARFSSQVMPLARLARLVKSDYLKNMQSIQRDHLIYAAARKILAGTSGWFSSAFQYRMHSPTMSKMYSYDLVQDLGYSITDNGSAIDGLLRFKQAHNQSLKQQDGLHAETELGNLLTGGSIAHIIQAINREDPTSVNLDFIRALNSKPGWFNQFYAFSLAPFTTCNALISGLDFHWFENRYAPFYAWCYTEPGAVIPFKNVTSVASNWTQPQRDLASATFVRFKQTTLLKQIISALKTDIDEYYSA